jgi:hypothetical protein
MRRRDLVRGIFVGALVLSACRRENSEKASDKSGAEPPSARPEAVSRPAPGPSALREQLGIPAGVNMETQGPAPAVTPVAARKVKSHGVLGDLLEGDVYFFTAESVKPCGEPATPSAGSGGQQGMVVVGAKVKIKAKSRLTVSPRELSLHTGGITLNASMDLKRELKGCTPLLKVGWLQKDETIEGFVLFDVPAPEPKDLHLRYLPTRWGGASAIGVKLPECVTCAGASPARAAR